jgi:hypothetical protein
LQAPDRHVAFFATDCPQTTKALGCKVIMPFPRPESYRTHKGPKGSPAEWATKASKLLQSKQGKDTEIFESLKVLGLSEVSTLTNLKQAFRKVTHKVHPDKGGSDAEFIKAKKAFDILSLFIRSKHV